MKRREAITAMCAMMVAPVAAQERRVRRIGVLKSGETQYVSPFLERMRALGYVEGVNLVVEVRDARGGHERLAPLARELVEARVELIVPIGGSATHAARQATGTIPIVTPVIADPVGTGLTTSLARPSANVTGLTNVGEELVAKIVEFARELVPTISRLAAIANPLSPAHRGGALESQAKRLGITIVGLRVTNAEEADEALAWLAAPQAQALFVAPDPLLAVHFRRFATAAIQARLPCLSLERSRTREGGLLSYGPDLAAMFRRSADLVDKILKGAKPADVPFERAERFDLAINLRTAAAIGLRIPQALLLQATEVIE